MRKTAFWHSSASRTALLYSALYVLSSLLSFVVLYLSATHDLRAQIREAVEQDVRTLSAIYRDQGRDALANTIRILSSSVEVRRSLYLLENPDGSVIAGNVPRTEPFVDWNDLTYTYSGHRSDHFFIYGLRLDDLWLFVGRRAHNVSEIQESILKSFGLGFAVSIPLAFIGILMLAQRGTKRVDGIANEMEAYINGDLSRRVPVQRRNDEIDRLSANINVLLSRIEKLISSLKQVTSDIAHDLRTPLSRLRQKLERAAAAEQVAPGTIEAAVGEIDEIIGTFDALLQIAQIDAGAKSLDTASVDLSEIGQFMSEVYAGVAEDRGQKLSFEGSTGALIKGDKRLLTQLIANLLENAIRHTPSGSRIDLRVRPQGDKVILAVADTGPGIPPQEREKVFDRFYRLDASRSTPGSGLGLPLVKAVATLHGAEIALSDNKPGLVITVTFQAGARSA